MPINKCETVKFSYQISIHATERIKQKKSHINRSKQMVSLKFSYLHWNKFNPNWPQKKLKRAHVIFTSYQNLWRVRSSVFSFKIINLPHFFVLLCWEQFWYFLFCVRSVLWLFPPFTPVLRSKESSLGICAGRQS